jgi:hypothetical protein
MMMRHLQVFVLVAGFLTAVAVAEARQAAPAQPARPATPSTPQRPAPPATPPQSSPGFILHEQSDARETREQLRDVLNQYPPSVREVLRIDPTLLYRPDYMATYPMLASFLEQHPEVAHNPGFFLGEWRSPEDNTPATEAFRTISDTMEDLTVVLIIATITAGIILLIRSVIEHRRWQRSMRAQTDLHTKLIDRFSSSDELIAYLQSPAGKMLTEAPALPQAAPRPMNAPLGRIFWSLQSGIVVGALGSGLIFVSTSVLNYEVRQFLYGVGIVVLTIGIGFAVSAAVSYVLSQRLGLVQSVSRRHSGEAPES